MKRSAEYGLDPIMITKVGIAESSFRSTKVNPYSGAVGIMGIMPRYWDWLFWYVCDKKYFNYLENHKGTNIIKVMKYIDANIAAGCYIISNYADVYNGDYRQVFTVYGGWRAKRFQHKVKQKEAYLSKILGE